MHLDAKTIQAAAGVSAELAKRLAEPMAEVCRVYGINTPKRQAAFIAQTAHESAGFTRLAENLNYSENGLLRTWPNRFTAEQARQYARRPEAIANYVYGGRLGNKEPGDGWRYRGRGWIMITGRANYAGITRLLREKCQSAPDLEVQPELLETMHWAAMSAGAYWNDHNLNVLADRGDFAGITKRINGGTNGAADRNARYAAALKALA